MWRFVYKLVFRRRSLLTVDFIFILYQRYLCIKKTTFVCVLFVLTSPRRQINFKTDAEQDYSDNKSDNRLGNALAYVCPYELP